ncbi:MAG: ATP-dependent sacrificial sulfur transferase LarE [Eubacteriales bacterium]|nr:ATP-dependent sacrificial sulfur transferase LarE [Eubacteriales bacterium]
MLDQKKEMLRNLFMEYGREDVCVAFSGGVDSSLVLILACEAAKRTGKRVYAVTMDTVLHPMEDLEAAKMVLKGTGAIHKVITLDELAVPKLADNPPDRCYLCKKALFGRMLDFARQEGCAHLLEGSNEDDLHVYRPGLLAVKELGVKSPLARCRITKEEVRALAAELGIPTAARPSAPCLATRLPYGARLDLALLKRIEKGEEYLKGLGLGNVRIRVHGDILRLETDLEGTGLILEKREEVLERLREVGCTYFTLDLEGFRSGSMDLTLEKE